MNPFLVELLSMLFRQAIIYAAGILGVSAIASQNMTQIQQWSASAAVFALTVGYAAYKKYTTKQVLVTALASPIPMSESEAKDRVKNPMVNTPSVKTPKTEVPY